MREKKINRDNIDKPISCGVKVEWSLNQPPEYIIELWSVSATVEAILKALAYKNERFLRDAEGLESKNQPEEQD